MYGMDYERRYVGVDGGTIAVVVIGSVGLAFTVYVQIKDYLHRRDDRTKWSAGVDTDRSNFKTFMSEIRSEIRKIHDRIDDIFGKLGGPATLQTASPITLTELGRSVSEKLGAVAWAEKRAPLLLDQVADVGAYDIQVFAYQYVEEEFTPDPAMEETIKQCAYDNGLRPKQVLDVLAIELRDRLLHLRQLEPQDHPEE